MLPSASLIIQSVFDGIFIGFLYSLVAVGLSLVFGVMGIINFAHGDFVMLSAYLTWILVNSLRTESLATSVFTTPLFFVLSSFIYFTVIKPILGREPLIQIAVTVGIGYVLQNIALMTFKAEPRATPSHVLNFYVSLGFINVHIAKLVAALLSLAVIISLHYLLTKTWFGLAVRATAYNREAAALMGINVDKVYVTVFGLGVALTALASSLWMSYGQVDPYLGASFGLVSWVITALGGLGGVSGVLASSVIIGVAESLTMNLISPSVKAAVAYIVFLVVLWFRPKGLFGGG